MLAIALAGSGRPPAWPIWFAVSFINLLANVLPEPTPGDRPLLAARLLAAAGGIVLLGLLPLHPEYLVLAVYLVWHSRSLAELDVPEARYRATVVAGVIGMLAALVIRAFAPILPGTLAVEQTVALATFAGAALLSLIVAQRLQLIEEENLVPSGGSTWIIAATAVSVAAGGTALLVLLAPPTAHGGLALLRILGNLLLVLLYYLLLPVVSLLFALVYGPLARLVAGMHLPPPHQPAQPDAAFAQLRQQQALLNSALDRWLHVAGWVLVALVLLAVLLLVSGGIRRRSDPSRRNGEQRASVWRWSLLGDWLGQWGQRGGAAAAAVSALLTRPIAFGQPRTVREIYQDVQRHALRLGYGRRPEQTALEHCTLLAERLPSVAPALQRLAVGYGGERYGGVPPADALSTLLPDWRQIVEACKVDGRNGT